MKSYLTRLFIYISSLIFWCGCACDEIDRQLSDIESRIATDPHTAQLQLDSLQQTFPTLFEEEALQARQILLRTYCMYHQSTEGSNDSLISLAENYYMREGTHREKMLCQFLHGVILYNAERETEAMSKYKSAEQEKAFCDEPIILGQLYLSMVSLCSAMLDADATRYADLALEEYKKTGDTLYVLDAKLHVGLSYLMTGQIDQCLDYSKRLIGKAQKVRDTTAIQQCLSIIAEAEMNNNQPDSAFKYFQEIIYRYHQPLCCHDNDLYALLWAQRNQKDSAYHYLKATAKLPTDSNNSQYHRYIEAKVNAIFGNHEKAYELLLEYIHQTFTRLVNNTVMKEQRDFVQRQLDVTMADKDTLSTIIIALLFALGVILTWVVVMQYRKNKQMQLQLDLLRKAKETEMRHRAEITAGQAENEELRNANKNLLDEIAINKCNQTDALQCIKLSDIFNKMKMAAQGKGEISSQDWNELYLLFCDNLPSFEQVLKNRFPISDSDFNLCMLIKLGFPPTEIATLINKDKSTVSAIRSRLYTQLIGQDDPAQAKTKALDEYIRSI